MNIIIVGGGKVGYSVAETLSAEGHDITMIDQNAAAIERISNALDVICVQGSAANPETLQAARVAEADLLLAATEKDEVNMICGIAAHRLGARHVVARIRDPEYLHQGAFLKETMGLSLIVNPEYECAREISRMLHFPSAVRVDTFSNGSVEIVDHRIPEGGKLAGMTLRELPQTIGAKVLVVMVERGGEALIPRGDFVLRPGDRLSISGSNAELRRFFARIGQYRRPVKTVMLMGGGRIAVYLTRMLLESGVAVTIIERDAALCERLCDLVPGATVVCGDATRNDVMNEEGLSRSDAFVTLTGDDGDNIITSLYARSSGVPKIITKVNRELFNGLLEGAGLDSTVSPKALVAQQLTAYVRALSASRGGGMESLHRLADGKAEALEFLVDESSRLAHKALRELKLKKNVLISAVIRGGKSLIPDGNTALLPGDHAVVVSLAGRLTALDQILEGER